MVFTGGSNAGTDTYSYDFENRLIGMVKGTAGTGTGTYAYQYDYRTRRITRDESSAGGVLTHLIFSGGTSVAEYDGTNTTPSVEYLRGSDYGGGVGGILYTVRSGTSSYTHANKRGDIVAKTDGSGNLTFQGQYNASGKVIASSGSTLDRQKSNSKDCDPWGGINDGQRISVIKGKVRIFLTRDPAGMIDGPNEYCYVMQNPWTKFDPEGLDTNDSNTTPQKPKEPKADQPSQFGPHVKDVPQPPQPSISARATQESSPDHKNGGFPQKYDGSCVPTATREVIYGATHQDPGDLSKEEATEVLNGSNHDWNAQGMVVTPGNQTDIMAKHGAKTVGVSYSTASELADKVGTTPVSVSVDPSVKGGASHQVTVTQSPDGKGYVITNPTGEKGVGGCETVTREQLVNGQIPMGTGSPKGAPTWKIDPGVGYTAVPMNSSESTQSSSATH